MIDPHDARSVESTAGISERAEEAAYTVIELLVVVGIIGVLVGLVLPALSRARSQGKSATCSSRLHTLGQGLPMYANDYNDALVPSRMPKIDDEHWRVDIEGGLKYRPTFLAMMGTQIGMAPFADPQASRVTIDREGEPGDRQNYASEAYLCPEVPDWTDERNGAFGYNYQFLGNSRLSDPNDVMSFKNWPVLFSSVRAPARTVAIGDSMGTAAGFPTAPFYVRRPYEHDNTSGAPDRSPDALGNEGFNLDPPWVEPSDGEIACEEEAARSGVDPRHLKRANILWLDGHCSGETPELLGYIMEEDGAVGLEGNNRLWSTNQRNCVWTRLGLREEEEP